MRILYVLIIALFISSCATGYSSLKRGPSEEELLRERVTLLWEAKNTNDWETVKGLVDPDLKDKVSPYLDSLKSKSTMNLASFSIKEIMLNADKATVISNVTWKLIAPPITSKSEITDTWIKRGDTWYVIMENPDFVKVLEKMGLKMKADELTK